jgi:hypothetical protein
MSGMSFEVVRAARLRVEQVTENALAQAQEAKEENRKLANDVNALRAFLMERLGEIYQRSTKLYFEWLC